MDLSVIGEAVLVAREGRRLKSYRDTVGVWTIGIGVTTINDRPVTSGMVITSAQCDALFDVTVARYVAAVKRGLKVAVPQNAFDALVSFCYNIGTGGFAGSTCLRRINAGDMPGARDAMMMWQKPPELISRRQAEAEQFVTPYTSAMPRATSKAKPIKVAAPVADVLAPTVRTPVIVPVSPTITAQPNLLMRFMRWIDDTYGDNPNRTANDNGAAGDRRAA